MKFKFLEQQLTTKRVKGQYRKVAISAEGLVNFASNDYLGLNRHPEIVSAFQQALTEYGTGSCSASLITGYTPAHRYLESQLCDWLGGERCMLFSSGYSANSGFFNTLLKTGQTQVFFDRLSHASMLSNMFHYPKLCSRFKHNNSADLAKRLEKPSDLSSIVAIEGVYSMDGDKGTVADLYLQANAQQAALYVDDAHGIGVLGEQGQGSLLTQFNQLPDDVTHMVTFGKALATQGAAIIGSEELIEFMTNYCSEYIFSTAMSAANAVATSKSIEICQNDNWRREKLNELQHLFKENLASELEITDSQTPIIGVITKDEERTLTIAARLKEQGFLVSAIRPPTVEIGRCRLRVTLSSNHNPSEVIGLANAINEVAVMEQQVC